MTTDFSRPQRQSKTGVLVLFLYSLVQYTKALFPLFLIYVVKQNFLYLHYVIIGVVVFTALIAIVSYLQFVNFTFYLDEKSKQFVISTGIFTKTVTSIQLNKIQQVNIDQSFLHKLIGTYELIVDSAGSNKNEGNIKAISHQMALALKSKLLENENAYLVENTDEKQIEVAENKSSQEIFLRIKLSTLIKVGLTSSYGKTLALILLSISTLYHNFGEYFDYEAVENIAEQNKINEITDKILIMELLLGLLLLSLFVVVLVNLFRTIFRFFNYEIAKQNDSMLFSYGLLNSKNIIIKFKKVQIVAVTQNFFQRKMGLSEIAISHASALDQQQRDKKKSLLEIPGCNDREMSALLAQIFDTVPDAKIRLKPNYRKLGFSVFAFLVIPISIFYIVRYYVWQDLYFLEFFTFVYGFFGMLILFFGFRNNKLFLGTNFVKKQSGAWDVTNEFIAIHKIQAITTSQLFWHKNLNIGNLKLHTAGGDLSFQLGNFETIKEYVNIWLYKIESDNNNWM